MGHRWHGGRTNIIFILSWLILGNLSDDSMDMIRCFPEFNISCVRIQSFYKNVLFYLQVGVNNHLVVIHRVINLDTWIASLFISRKLLTSHLWLRAQGTRREEKKGIRADCLMPNALRRMPVSNSRINRKQWSPDRKKLRNLWYRTLDVQRFLKCVHMESKTGSEPIFYGIGQNFP